MTHHIPHVLDACVLAIVGLAATAGGLVLTDATTTLEQAAEMRLFLLPATGALIGMGIMIMMNPQPETRKIVIGRSLAGLAFGVLIPQIIGMFHPSLAALSVRPPILALSGLVICCLTYALSKPFTRQMYERAEGIAKREAERLEAKYSPPVGGPKEAPYKDPN